MISYADLHADTLFRCFVEQTDLKDTRLHIYTDLSSCFDRHIQVYAHYIPEQQPDKWEWFLKFLANSQSLLQQAAVPLLADAQDIQVSHGAIFSIEGGDLFECIEQGEKRIAYLKDRGFSFYSLIYNHTNRFGSGARSEDDMGLTALGKEAVSLLEYNRIFPDVSHASYKATNDILDVAKGPVCATHSNALSLMPNTRNLCDEHLKRIAESGGLIGINLYPPFLGQGRVDRQDIIRHISYIINLCCEDAVAFGSDFDGVDYLPSGIENLLSMEQLLNDLKQFGYSEAVLEKLFYENIYNFLKANLRR